MSTARHRRGTGEGGASRTRLVPCLVAVLGFVLGLLFGPGAERAFAQDGEGHAEDPGRSVYEESCVRCHRDGGRGVEGVFPSLRDNDLVRGSSEALVIMVLEGRAAMPGFAETLSDQEIAAVVSYLRSNWGNEAKRIAEDEIAEVRKQVETPASRPRPGTHDEG